MRCPKPSFVLSFPFFAVLLQVEVVNWNGLRWSVLPNPPKVTWWCKFSMFLGVNNRALPCCNCPNTRLQAQNRTTLQLMMFTGNLYFLQWKCTVKNCKYKFTTMNYMHMTIYPHNNKTMQSYSNKHKAMSCTTIKQTSKQWQTTMKGDPPCAPTAPWYQE